MHRVGVIGSGNMARVHTRHWSRIPGIEIAGLVSVDSATREKLAASLNAPLYDSFEELLDKGRPDVIDICTPTFLHPEFALKSLRAGKHTFLEKPMARTLDECDRIIEAHKAAGVAMMVGHVVRFFPEFEAARNQAAGGAVGTIATARSARLSSHPKGAWQNWYADPDKSGGVVLDMIIHDFDWLRWTVGEVDRVYARGLYKSAEYTGKLDYALVTLHFKSGAVGHVCGSWAHPGGFRTQFELCGDRGMIEHDSARSSALTAAMRQPEGAGPGTVVPESPLFESDDPYYRELKHFIDSIDSGSEPAITLADARAAVAIGCAALESIETGRVVKIG